MSFLSNLGDNINTGLSIIKGIVIVGVVGGAVYYYVRCAEAVGSYSPLAVLKCSVEEMTSDIWDFLKRGGFTGEFIRDILDDLFGPGPMPSEEDLDEHRRTQCESVGGRWDNLNQTCRVNNSTAALRECHRQGMWSTGFQGSKCTPPRASLHEFQQDYVNGCGEFFQSHINEWNKNLLANMPLIAAAKEAMQKCGEVVFVGTPQNIQAIDYYNQNQNAVPYQAPLPKYAY